MAIAARTRLLSLIDCSLAAFRRASIDCAYLELFMNRLFSISQVTSECPASLFSYLLFPSKWFNHTSFFISTRTPMITSFESSLMRNVCTFTLWLHTCILSQATSPLHHAHVMIILAEFPIRFSYTTIIINFKHLYSDQNVFSLNHYAHFISQIIHRKKACRNWSAYSQIRPLISSWSWSTSARNESPTPLFLSLHAI